MVQLRIFIPYVLVIVLSLTAVFAQTTAPAKANCETKSNTSCEACLKDVSCLWCRTTKKCINYPVKTILPPHSLCPLNEARWGLCWVNFQALIIAMSVIAGVIIIAILICCFCCCKCENVGSQRAEAKMDKQADKRKGRQEERKTEMKMRHEEIRKKYGLSGANPYSKFENN
ncbi:pituitary tumor-transforming gene 1 protein-interacting protein-like [Anguilla anguilla]|uniref:pituitary tumor-transforming gene 1 protein-interacting protein-like n=1 Tax=Anguilla anguilla TaxID=7936 RepID=UPI0015B2FD46|nr:pituitary tumor-transforming gene 1 protein-interacting protein-like [Anguilla anguilla]